MFGAAFQRGGESENVGFTATVQGDYIRNAESSFGERARLVEYDGVERARTLEGRAIADQQSVPRRDRGRNGHDQGDREAERMGTGDHHDRHHSLEREIKAASTGEPG